MRRTLLPLLLLGLAAPAAAAPPWSDPQRVSTPHDFVMAQSLVTGQDGRTLALWSSGDVVRSTPSEDTWSASRATGAPAFAPQQPIRAKLHGARAYGSSRVAALVRDDRRVAVAFGRTDGRFGRPRTVALTRGRVAAAALAANDRGRVVVAWIVDRGTVDDLMVSIRSSRGDFSRPVRLARDRLRGVSAAIGPRADVLVAWNTVGRVRARLRPARRRAFGPVDTIRSDDAFNARLHTEVNFAGRAMVAWSARFRSEGGEAGPGFVQAAVRVAGASRFRPAVRLESGDTGEAGLARGPGREFVVAWRGAGGGIRAATTRGGAFGPIRTVDVGGELGDVAADEQGQAVVVWRRGTTVRAADYRGGVFGPVQEVGDAEPELPILATVDPRTDHAIVIWSGRPDDPAQTRLLASVRG